MENYRNIKLNSTGRPENRNDDGVFVSTKKLRLNTYNTQIYAQFVLHIHTLKTSSMR